MIYHQYKVESEECQLIPYGDLHLGDKAFGKHSKAKLEENLEKTRRNKNARVLLMGDIFNCSTRDSKTSPYEQISEQELDLAIRYFEPVKDKIIGALDGNHEDRLIDFANFSIMNAFCKALGIPYFGTCVALELQVGKRDKQRKGMSTYQICAHHTKGGGGKHGSKVNTVDRLKDNVLAGADIYLGAHHHGLFSVVTTQNIMDTKAKRINNKKQYLVGTGSYLEWNNSYAEKHMLQPSHLGSPVITLGGAKKNIHVSI